MDMPIPRHAMDQQFLTIKQATERYVVSDITLRRLAREITRDGGHEFREYIRPIRAELEQFKRENRPFEYELSTKLLGLRYKLRSPDTEEGSATIGDTRADVGTAAMSILESTNDLLREQLHVKDDQIRQLNESLRAMQQQQNATTAVLVRLTERIPLLTEPAAGRAVAVTAQRAPATATATVVKDDTLKKNHKPRPKPVIRSRGLFRRLFRREPATAGAGK